MTTASMARTDADEPILVVVDSAAPDDVAAGWARYLAHRTGSSVQTVELPAERAMRDFCVAGRDSSGPRPSELIRDAVGGARMIVIAEHNAHHVIISAREALHPRSALPAQCALVVVGSPAPS